MKKLSYPNEDDLSIEPIFEDHSVMLESNPANSETSIIIISLDRLPVVISYLQACLKELNKARTEEA